MRYFPRWEFPAVSTSSLRCAANRLFDNGLISEDLKILADVEGLRAAVLNLTLNAIEAAGAGGATGRGLGG